MMIVIALPFLILFISQRRQTETSNLCNIHAYAWLNLGWLKAKVTKTGVKGKIKKNKNKQQNKRQNKL